MQVQFSTMLYFKLLFFKKVVQHNFSVSHELPIGTTFIVHESQYVRDLPRIQLLKSINHNISTQQ